MNIGCFIDENRGISNIQMKKKKKVCLVVILENVSNISNI